MQAFQTLASLGLGQMGQHLGLFNDALPTPWRTQMWVQVKDNGRKRSRDALPSS
jgi:hypothetical protein